MQIQDALAIALLARAGERFLIVLVSGLCLWLGYRLFSNAGLSHGGAEGELKDIFSFRMTNVAPGTFFALFGATVLVYGLATQLKLEEVKKYVSANGNSGQVERVVYYGLPVDFGKDDGRKAQRAIASINVANDLLLVARENKLSDEQNRLAQSALSELEFVKRGIVDAVSGEGTYQRWAELHELRTGQPARFGELSSEEKLEHQKLTELVQSGLKEDAR